MIHTSFMWASSSLRGPFHEQPREAPVHLIKRRLTFVRRVTLASRLEGRLAGAEQVSTGQDLELGEQDEQMTSPSGQIYEMGRVGTIQDRRFQSLVGSYSRTVTGSQRTFLQTGQDSESPGGCRKRLCSNISTPSIPIDHHKALTASYPILPSAGGKRGRDGDNFRFPRDALEHSSTIHLPFTRCPGKNRGFSVRCAPKRGDRSALRSTYERHSVHLGKYRSCEIPERETN